MQDWYECPEASGPQTEGAINNVQYGDPGYPSIGRPPLQLTPEQMEKERAADARRHEARCRVERAALAAGLSALESAAAADRLQAEAGEIADKAARS
jgi:hypothetical protein